MSIQIRTSITRTRSILRFRVNDLGNIDSLFNVNDVFKRGEVDRLRRGAVRVGRVLIGGGGSPGGGGGHGLRLLHV